MSQRGGLMFLAGCCAFGLIAGIVMRLVGCT